MRGFTLAETVIAVFVLGVGIVGALSIISVALNREEMAKKNTEAVYLAQGEIETLISSNYDSSLLSPGDTSTTTDGYSVRKIISYVNPDNGFNTSTDDLGIKKIKVIVSWGSGSDKNVELSTLITKK